MLVGLRHMRCLGQGVEMLQELRAERLVDRRVVLPGDSQLINLWSVVCSAHQILFRFTVVDDDVGRSDFVYDLIKDSSDGLRIR